MGLVNRLRAWLSVWLMPHCALQYDVRALSDVCQAAMDCADLCNGRIVILYDTDAGTGIRYLGMGKQDMLIKLRGMADAIDLANADLMGRH